MYIYIYIYIEREIERERERKKERERNSRFCRSKYTQKIGGKVDKPKWRQLV